MSKPSQVYPEKCRLCGAERCRIEDHDMYTHSQDCQWRTDPSWRKEQKPVQTGHLDLAVRWSNGSSTINATITQEQYQRILAITQEKS